MRDKLVLLYTIQRRSQAQHTLAFFEMGMVAMWKQSVEEMLCVLSEDFPEDALTPGCELANQIL